MTDWRDLSDVELRMSLSQRGVDTHLARWAVDHRDDVDTSLVDGAGCVVWRDGAHLIDHHLS